VVSNFADMVRFIFFFRSGPGKAIRVQSGFKSGIARKMNLAKPRRVHGTFEQYVLTSGANRFFAHQPLCVRNGLQEPHPIVETMLLPMNKGAAENSGRKMSWWVFVTPW